MKGGETLRNGVLSSVRSTERVEDICTVALRKRLASRLPTRNRLRLLRVCFRHSSSNCTENPNRFSGRASPLQSLARQGMEPLAKKSLRHACGHVGHENSLHLVHACFETYNDKPRTENQPCEAQPASSFLHRRPHNHACWPSRLNLANFSLIWQGQRAVPPKSDLRSRCMHTNILSVRVSYTWPLRADAAASDPCLGSCAFSSSP